MQTGVPQTRYCKSSGVHIAYQVVGSGPVDLVFVPGAWGHLEHRWEEPGYARLFDRISSFARLILFDRRGTGLSDRGDHVPSMEVQIGDVLAVMDAVGSARAAVWGQFDGGAMAALFAATHPERVDALITYAAFAKPVADADYPGGIAVDAETVLRVPEDQWEKPGLLPLIAPSRLDDERFKEWWARNQRLGASPAGAAALVRMIAETDIRAVLPTIRVPTLVLQRRNDRLVPPENGRFLANSIPGAKYVELVDGDYFIGTGDVDGVADEIAEFLTGVRPAKPVEERLAAILVASIAEADARATQLGDRRWRATVDRYEKAMRRIVERLGGAVVRAGDDGTLATFDGPARAVRCGREIVAAVHDLDLEVGVGVHAGEIQADTPSPVGVAFHVTSRIASLARPGEVLASRTIVDLVAGSGQAFATRGSYELLNAGDEWQVYAAISEPRDFEAAWRSGARTTIGNRPTLAPQRAQRASGVPLTPREREVARLLAAGYTNRQIADRLVISERTAEAHVANILRKLQANTRAEAAARLARLGLPSP